MFLATEVPFDYSIIDVIAKNKLVTKTPLT